MAAAAGAKLYLAAGGIVARLCKKQGTVKSLCLASSFSDKKRLYALVYNALQYRSVLLEIIKAAGLLKAERKLSEAMALVLVHDLLLSKSGVQCGGELKKRVMKHKVRLKAEASRVLVRNKVQSLRELGGGVSTLQSLPRYARVNALKIQVEDAVAGFQERGFQLVDASQLADLAPNTFCRDPHLPDLLAFAPQTDFHADPDFLEGRVILQDKASCFPAHALRVAPGACCIDACAAPGNKTSHLAALMGNQGRIFAFDISAPRLKTLAKLHARAGVTCTTVKNQSFLDTDPSSAEYAGVQHILLDPSCSGSGIVSRLNDVFQGPSEADETEGQADRLSALAKFQGECILHAMQFPAVRRISYSTCSIFQEENEDVVKAVLGQTDRFQLSSALPQWPRRGNDVLDSAELLVRCDPQYDLTNGFFVAVFERAAGAAGADGDAAGAPAGAPMAKRKKKKRKRKRPKRQRDEDSGDAGAEVDGGGQPQQRARVQ